MANDQVEEIKQKVDIVELISEYVPLKRSGRNFKALCPFHSEKTPSFMVSPELSIFKCFGCGTSGDVYTFLQEMEGMEFAEALETLAKRTGVKLRRLRPSGDDKEKKKLYEINHLAAEFYHYLLTQHRVGQMAKRYLMERGINQDSITRFKLGFAPETWDGLQKFLVGKKGYQLADLEKAGLVIPGKKQKGSYYDRFRGRIMFPIWDHRDNPVGFSGRILPGSAEVKEEEGAKYVNTPETAIYHKSSILYGLNLAKKEIKKADQAVVVEGQMDVISSTQAGLANTAALTGSALTEEHARLLKRFSPNLVLALDRDIAGDSAARRGVEIADQAGLTVRVVRLAGGRDPDEVAQKSPDMWRQLVEKALPVYDYFLESAFDRHDAKTAEGKRAIGQELTAAFAKISDEIVKSHYVRRLAEKLGVSEEAILSQMAKTKPEAPASPKKAEEAERKSRRELLEEYLFTLAFQGGWPKEVASPQTKALIVTPSLAEIAKQLVAYFKKYKTFDSGRFARFLPEELVEIYNRLYLYDLGNLAEEEERLVKEMAKVVRELERISLRQELTTLSAQIKELEGKEGKKRDLVSAQKQFRQASEKLSQLSRE